MQKSKGIKIRYILNPKLWEVVDSTCNFSGRNLNFQKLKKTTLLTYLNEVIFRYKELILKLKGKI